MTNIVHRPREQWLMRRRELVTASDAAAVLGFDPFRTPADIYAEKIGATEPVENEAMRWGKRFEPAIADGYALETLRLVLPEPEYEIAIHPELPWLGATLDRGVDVIGDLSIPRPEGVAGKGALELKASTHEWEEEPPTAYQIQLTIQMACTAREWGSLAAFLSMWKPVVWVDRVFDRELFDFMVPKLSEFHWRVRERKPSDDPAWYSRAAIRALWATDDGSAIALDHEALADVEKWELAKSVEANACTVKELAEDRIRLRLGNASVGFLPDGTSVSLKTTPATTIAAYTRESFRVLRRFRPKGKTTKKGR